MMSPEINAGKIAPFPFAGLPRYEASRVVLEAKLRRLYTAFVGNTDAIQQVESHLGEIFKTAVALIPSQLREMALEEIVTELPGRFIGALVRLDPYPKRGFLIFETVLAHELAHAVLAGNAVAKLTPAELTQPMTALEEAVVEYAVLGILESLQGATRSVNVTPVFEDFFRDAKRLLSIFSHHDRFAAFSLKVKTQNAERLARVVVPVAMVETWEIQAGSAVLPGSGGEKFADFRLDFQLSIGSVTLDENEVTTLHEGDIVLLDECSAEFSSGKLTGGSGWFRPVGGDPDAYKGFEVKVRRDEAGIHGVVVGAG